MKIAEGSCGEVRAQIMIAADLNYTSKKEWADFCQNLPDECRLIETNHAPQLKKPTRIPSQAEIP
jgi:four helix bundle protein